MRDRLRDHLERIGLLPPGVRVLAGYSGGADSTCMLHLLHALGVDVVGAHLHHGMRLEADEERDRCQQFCATLGVDFVSGNADVPRISKDFGIGLEEAGRRARYAFFERAKAQSGALLVATGHTRTDRVETVLINLARGCGLSGAGGIPAKHGDVVRPMLIFSREETRSYCRELSLWHHDDPANEDLKFSRARIRHQVMPQLEFVNPRIEEAIERFADLAEADDRFLDGAAAAALEQTEIALNGALRFLTEDCEVAFERRGIAHLPDALLSRAIRLATSAVGAQLDFDQTRAALAGIRGCDVGAVTAEGGEVAIEWSQDRVHIRQIRPAEPFRFTLAVPGETESAEFGWRISATRRRADASEQKRAELRTLVEPKSLNGSLYFRSAADGDSIEPFGFEGRRKVSDLLSEAKLTLAARRRLPIICDMAGPIWIPGVCLSNRVKLEGKASEAVDLRFEPIRPHEDRAGETMNSSQTYAN